MEQDNCRSFHITEWCDREWSGVKFLGKGRLLSAGIFFTQIWKITEKVIWKAEQEPLSWSGEELEIFKGK